MKKKIIYLSVFSLFLFACKKEIIQPNNMKSGSCMGYDANNSPSMDMRSSQGGGSSSSSNNPTDTNAVSITDPNNDEDAGSGSKGGPKINGKPILNVTGTGAITDPNNDPDGDKHHK